MKVFLCLLLLLTGWSFGQSSKDEPSLVDLSKQARERKAKTEKPARLITNADLTRYQNAPVSISKSDETEEEAAEGDNKDKEKEQKTVEGAEGEGQPEAKVKDMAFWTSAFEEARLNYKNAVNRGLVLQLRLNNLVNSFYREDDGTTQGMLQQQMETTREEIEKNKTEIAEARKVIDRLQREARDAGLEESTIIELVGQLPDPASIEGVPAPAENQ
jgi:hypothetical protein